jgi:hypothetical protein
MTSDDNSCDEQARVVIIIMSFIADVAHFISKKTSHLISEISYMTS